MNKEGPQLHTPSTESITGLRQNSPKIRDFDDYTERQVSPAFQLEEHLTRKSKEDLLKVHTRTLSLRERLRQRRQYEHAIYKGRHLVNGYRYGVYPASEIVEKGLELAGYDEDYTFDLASQFESQDEILEFLHDYFSSFRRSRRMQMVLDSFSGMTIDQIAKRHNVTNHQVSAAFSPFRRETLEPRILNPLGFMRVSRAPQRIIDAVGNETFKPYEILLIHYATPEQLADYENRRRKINPDLLAAGWVLLDEACNAQEWDILTKNPYYTQKIHKESNRLYIRAEDLDSFRTNHQIRHTSHANPERKRMSKTEYTRLTSKSKIKNAETE